MIDVLVVEDDAEKLRKVMLCLQTVRGVNAPRIESARDVVDAKRLLREKQYDLLVLDVSLPERSDQAPAHTSGILLLNELLERDIYAIPKHIVGLTAHQDALELATPTFEKAVLQVIFYDPSSRDWEERLRKIARRAVQAENCSVADTAFKTHICIVAALETPELEAVLALPWNWEIKEVPSDPTIYHRGSYTKDGQSFEVVAAAAARMGMTASAVLATKMAMTFKPRYLVMVGITAGIEGECELGDILVADPCWDYESGKRTVRGGKPVFSAAPHQLGLNPFMRSKLAKMLQDHAVFDEIRRTWSGQVRKTVLSMRIGPVASGAAVLEDPALVATIRSQHRKTLGIEMEAYGVMVAADESPLPQVTALAIKSVCDFADPRKNNEHQKYAAYTSASALRVFAERYL